MQNEERLSPAERELEAALSALHPAGAKIDRDRLMFLAGRASGRRRSRLWQCAAGTLAAALGVALLARPAPREVERVVYVTVARPAPAAPSPPAVEVPKVDRWRGEPYYLRVRDEVLAKGLDALPAAEGSTAEPRGPGRVRRPLLRLNDLLRGEEL